MRFCPHHLLTIALVFLCATSAFAAPTMPGIGRHRNPVTVAARQAVARSRSQPLAAEPVFDNELELSRTDRHPESEKRMEERMEGVLKDMGEAKKRNEEKKKKRARLARFHP